MDDISLGMFMYTIRKKCKLEKEKSIYFFINNKLFNNSALLKTIYLLEKHEDGFLHVVINEETTFG